MILVPVANALSGERLVRIYTFYILYKSLDAATSHRKQRLKPKAALTKFTNIFMSVAVRSLDYSEGSSTLMMQKNVDMGKKIIYFFISTAYVHKQQLQ